VDDDLVNPTIVLADDNEVSIEVINVTINPTIQFFDV